MRHGQLNASSFRWGFPSIYPAHRVEAFIMMAVIIISLFLLYLIVGAIIKMSGEVVLDKTIIGRYYRTTIPEKVRRFLEVGERDGIEWSLTKARILVRKVSR